MECSFLPASAPVRIVAGDRQIFTGEKPEAAIIFADADEANRILAARDLLQLSEAFVEGRMDIEGDIFAVVGLRHYFYPEHLSLLDRAQIVFRVLKEYKRHTPGHDRRYIAHHYELPDDFYRLFLGESMTYSCAYFTDPNMTLEAAQESKIDHLLSKLQLQPGERLLDIGCGWGSLVIRAATKYQAKVVGITLSRTQVDFARSRIRVLGLEDVCEVRLADYRDLADEAKLDKVVSVGMYEHVGNRNLSTYFRTVFDLLRPDGLFVNHGITRKFAPDWERVSEALFLGRYIFPGGELYSHAHVAKAIEAEGFEVYDSESLRRHYAITLRHWVANLQDNQGEARRLVSESIYRAWLLYMAGCASAFEEGYLNVHQISGSKTTRYGGEIPLTRSYLYQ